MSVTASADPQSNQALSVFDQRRCVPSRQLGEPAPDDATLLRMLQSAVRVPDHGKRVPFRFVRIRGAARQSLGESLAARALQRDPGASDSAIDKDRNRFNHAPLVVAEVAVLDPADTSIPERERVLTAGCVCFTLLQAAQALGFGATWLTGWPAYDTEVLRLLGLVEHEQVAGFIHIGTPLQAVPERERPDPASLLSDWTPA